MKKFVSLTILGVVMGLAGASLAWAGDTPCPPHLGAVTVDNVVVNGQCTLEGTRVTGNVFVRPNGNLLVRNARIEGNVQAENAARVRLLQSRVGGDVQLFGTQGGRASRIVRTDIGGNLQIEDSTSSHIIRLNTIDGDLQAKQNTGGLTIEDNDIGGNLQCQANNPAPIGGNNTVDGSKEDQCENL
jgi:hypothetical protein